MAEQVYECMFILDPNRYARDPGGVSSKINETIEKTGGEILASRLWNEQKMAYPIKGHRKGVYWLTYFRIKGELCAKLNREFQLNDNILRNLMVKLDPRLSGTMVALARGEKTEESPEAEQADTEPEKTETPSEEPATAES